MPLPETHVNGVWESTSPVLVFDPFTCPETTPIRNAFAVTIRARPRQTAELLLLFNSTKPRLSELRAPVRGRLNCQLSAVPPPPKLVVEPNSISNRTSTFRPILM